MANIGERGSRNININERDRDLIRTRDEIQDMLNILSGGRSTHSPPTPQGPPNYPTSRHYSEYDPGGPLAGKFTPQLPQVDPLQAILAQLRQFTQGTSQMPRFNPQQLPTYDPNRFKNQAMSAVNEQFNPIINQILAQQSATQSRAATSQSTVRNLYNQLGAVEDRGAVADRTRYATSQAQSKNLYEDQRDQIAAGYARDAAAQRAEAKRLGIESLGLNEELTEQQGDMRFANQMSMQEQQAQQAAMSMQGNAQQDYDRAIANATRAEGIESSQDIGRQLEDYLAQSNTDLTGVRSQRAGSINDLMLKLADAAYQRDVANTQFGYQQQRDYLSDQNALFDRSSQAQNQQLDLAMKLLQLQGGGAGSAGSSAGEQKLNPWQETATFAEQLAPGRGSDIVSVIQGAMYERPEIWGRNEGNSAGVEMNPALFARLIADSQSAQQLDPNSKNALMQATQILYKLLYGVG